MSDYKIANIYLFTNIQSNMIMKTRTQLEILFTPVRKINGKIVLSGIILAFKKKWCAVLKKLSLNVF